MVKTVTICENIFHQIFEESVSVKILHYTVITSCSFEVISLIHTLVLCNVQHDNISAYSTPPCMASMLEL